eukprot:521137_1
MAIQWILPMSIPITFISVYFTWILLIIWHSNKFFKYRSITYIAKRYPIVTLTEIIFIVSAIAANFSVIILYRSISETDHLYQHLWNFSIFSHPITSYGIFYSILWRFWHFYHDSTLNIKLESQWKTIINPKSMETVNNWHLINTYSPQFVFKRVFLMYLISCIISISSWFMEKYISYHLALFIDFLVFLVPYTLIMILYRKTPIFGDELHVKDEMRLINIFIVMSLSTYLVIIIIGAIIGKYQLYFTLIMNISACFYVFLIAMTHTKWVLDHIHIWMKHTLNSITVSTEIDRLPPRLKSFIKDKNVSSQIPKISKISSLPSFNLSTNIFGEDKSRANSTVDNNNPINKQNVIEILQNENTFNAFVVHLNAEFCLECILSFLEIIQFEQYLVKNRNKLNNISKSNKNGNIKIDIDNNKCVLLNEQLIHIEFKDYIPISQIVYNDMDKNRECDIIIAKK